MRYSFIDWSAYDLKPLAEKALLDEDTVYGVFDREAGFHMVDGACSKSKKEITERVAHMLHNHMDGEVNRRQLYGPNDELLMPASMEELENMVRPILDQMQIEWSSPKVKDFL
jgi:hypothetical protein